MHAPTCRQITTGDGLVVVRMLAAMAATESATKSRRVARYLAGESSRSLVTWLVDIAVPTVQGGKRTTSTMREIIANPRIAGLRRHRGEVVGPIIWEPVITVADHQRVLAAFAARKVSGRRSPRRYLLSGLLRCGRCGNRLYSARREQSRRRYVCASGPDHGGCGRLTVVAEPLEAYVADLVIELRRPLAHPAPHPAGRRHRRRPRPRHHQPHHPRNGSTRLRSRPRRPPLALLTTKAHRSPTAAERVRSDPSGDGPERKIASGMRHVAHSPAPGCHTVIRTRPWHRPPSRLAPQACGWTRSLDHGIGERRADTKRSGGRPGRIGT